MARKPQVTRTIQTTNVVLMVCNTETTQVENINIVLPRTYADNAAILKAARKVAETDTIKCVAVVSSKVAETLYGMSEEDFIAHAKVLPPRSGSATEDNEDATELELTHPAEG